MRSEENSNGGPSKKLLKTQRSRRKEGDWNGESPLEGPAQKTTSRVIDGVQKTVQKIRKNPV